MRDELCGCSSVEPLAWAVIGAASNGNTYYQPDPDHLKRLLDYLDAQNCRIFFKGNLRPSLGKVIPTWREEFPEMAPAQPRLK